MFMIKEINRGLRMTHFYNVLTYLLVICYNLIIIGGTTWLVMNGWSGWWYLLAICLLHGIKETNNERK